MDKNTQELLLSIARSLESLAEHEQDYAKESYLLLISEYIYTYLDTVETD